MAKKYKTALLVVDLQNDFTRPWGSVYREPTGEMMERVCNNINLMRDKGVYIVIVYSGGPEYPFKNTNRKASEVSRTYNEDGRRRCLIEGTPGFEIDSRISIDKERDLVWHKTAASAFFKNNLEQILLDKGIENVLVCGVKTNVCCRATANDAFSCGFRTFVVSDMVATNTPELNQFFLDDMSKYIAKAISSEEVFERIDRGDL